MDNTELSKLIGTPYEVLDCWGIAKEFYRIAFGVELKAYYDGTPQPRDIAENLIYSNKGEFEKVVTPQYGDLIIIRLFGVESHVAVYLDGGRILHTSKNNGCYIDRLSKWNHLISGYYRVKDYGQH
jgi:cell wall-associated NlpC family hydrolase